MPLVRTAAKVIFTVWFLVSAAAQYPDDSYSRVRRLGGPLTNSFLIPNWKFFAPNPGIEDVILLYRTGDSASGTWSEWARVLPIYRPNLIRSFVSRDSRLNKGLLDIYATLQEVSNFPQRDGYVACRDLLLSIVAARIPRPLDAKEFQVMVVHGTGYEERLPPRYDIVFEPQAFGAVA